MNMIKLLCSSIPIVSIVTADLTHIRPKHDSPRFTMQYGVLVISTRRTGSQKPMEIPGMGIGGVPLLQIQTGLLGFLVSRFLG